MRLVEDALLGWRSAQEELVGRLLPVVRSGVAKACFGPAAEVEDLVQEVWLALFEDEGARLEAFDPSRGGGLEAFVSVVAGRVARQRVRERRTKKRGVDVRVISIQGEREDLSLPDPHPTPDVAAEGKQVAARLVAFLEAKLPERGRLVLRLVFTDGVPPDEAARALGVRVQVVYNWQHKVRALSRKFLGNAVCRGLSNT